MQSEKDGNYFYSAEHLCWRDYKAQYKHSFLEPSSLHAKTCFVGPRMHQFSCLKWQRGSDTEIELNQFGDIHQSYTRCFSKDWPSKCHLLEHTTSQPVAVTQELSKLWLPSCGRLSTRLWVPGASRTEIGPCSHKPRVLVEGLNHNKIVNKRLPRGGSCLEDNLIGWWERESAGKGQGRPPWGSDTGQRLER